MTAEINGRTQNSKSIAKSYLSAHKVCVLSSRGNKDLFVLLSHKMSVIKMLILKVNNLASLIGKDCKYH